MDMIEMVKCECCGLKEECTQEYITQVRSKFHGQWLCGLCGEAVTDETTRPGRKKNIIGMDDAVKAHMSFCRQNQVNNPATCVADGMRQMLRRRSASSTTPKKGDHPSLSYC